MVDYNLSFIIFVYFQNQINLVYLGKGIYELDEDTCKQIRQSYCGDLRCWGNLRLDIRYQSSRYCSYYEYVR